MKRRHLLMAGALALAGCAAKAPPQPASTLQLPSGWRALSKNESAFMAPALNAAGATVVVPDYDLAPAASLDHIVDQMRRALAWTFTHIARWGGDPERICVSGSSAGGHLTGMLVAGGWQSAYGLRDTAVAVAAFPLSGLFDLQPLLHTEINGWMGLDDAAAQRNSPRFQLPSHLSHAHCALRVACGEFESLDEVMGNVRQVAQAAGVAARGEALVLSLAQRLAAVDAQVAGQSAPRALMITGRMGNGMLLVARPGTYTNEAMLRAGARHAIPGIGTLAQVSPEAALAADPDVLLFAGAQPLLDELTRRPGWRDMRAVRAQRAITVSRAEFLIPGPRTFDGIETLARWIMQTQQKGWG